MTSSPNRQTRKRLATRQRISDVATRLFVERGFDAVTIDEIAEAADVSRMTVFNHFARKEDLFFDLDEEGRGELVRALEQRPAGISPVEALRQFAHWAMRVERPYTRFHEAGSDRFMATIQASEALKARARAIRDELTDTLTAALGSVAGSATGGSGPPAQHTADADAHLAASLVLATWTVALMESYRAFQQHGDVAAANAVFLDVVDRGARGVEAALQGTPYVDPGPRLPG